MLNEVKLIGRLGNDPEVKTLDNGNKLVRVSLGTTEFWKDKNGEKQEETTWHSVTLFGALADNAERILQKGSLVYISGKIKNKVVDKDGEKRKYTDITANEFKILTDGKKNPNYVAPTNTAVDTNTTAQQPVAQQATVQQPVAQQATVQQPVAQTATIVGTDDDLPF
jgi:single-strand DNA-binding protein